MNNQVNLFDYMDYVNDYTIERDIFLDSILLYNINFTISCIFIIMPNILNNNPNLNDDNYFKFKSFLNQNDNNISTLCNTIFNILLEHYKSYVANMDNITIVQCITDIKQHCYNNLSIELNEQFGINLYNFTMSIIHESY
jgi:hypothetical protein